jgi:hypothetical protein
MLVNEILIFVVVGVCLIGVTFLVCYMVMGRKETTMQQKIQDNYERLNKEMVAADQAVQDLTINKIDKVNESLMNVADSVQNVSNSGGDTTITGDLCINNLCFGSSGNNHVRVNLDDLPGLTTKFMQNFAGVQSSVSASDLKIVKNELEKKIAAVNSEF